MSWLLLQRAIQMEQSRSSIAFGFTLLGLKVVPGNNLVGFCCELLRTAVSQGSPGPGQFM